MAAAGEQCTQCWVGSLQLHEGMLVCEECGSIHQGFAEETQEYQVGISDARFFKKSEGMRGGTGLGSQGDEPRAPAPVEAALAAYVNALQALLRRQAAALVTSFGVNTGVSPVLKELWLAFLAHSQLLEPEALTRLQALAEHAATGARSEDGSGGSDEEGRMAVDEEGPRRAGPAAQMTHERLSLKIEQEIGPKLRPQHTLILLLLACWQQGEAVSPLDVARWSMDGNLPYLSFPAVEGAALQQYSAVLGRRLITPRGVPSPKFLAQEACQVAELLGLLCPPLSPPLWLERYAAQLDLPQELVPLALELHFLYQPALPLPTDDYRAHRHPWALLLASLLLAVKLCYGLDGSSGRDMPGLPPAPAWPDWAQCQLVKLGRLSAFPMSLKEAAQLDEAGLRAYLQYLQQGLFASFQPPSELESAHRLFLRLAALPADPPGGEGAQPGDAPGDAAPGGEARPAEGPGGSGGGQVAAGAGPSQPLGAGLAARGKAWQVQWLEERGGSQAAAGAGPSQPLGAGLAAHGKGWQVQWLEERGGSQAAGGAGPSQPLGAGSGQGPAGAGPSAPPAAGPAARGAAEQAADAAEAPHSPGVRRKQAGDAAPAGEAWQELGPQGSSGRQGTSDAGPSRLPGAGLAATAAEEDAAAGAAEPAEDEQPPAGDGYLFYGARPRRQGVGAVHSGLFHPDYALVLTACAPLVWLVPEALHDLLARLEQAMISAECEVSFAYNEEEQARLERIFEEGAMLRGEREQQPTQRRGSGQREQPTQRRGSGQREQPAQRRGSPQGEQQPTQQEQQPTQQE